MSMRADLLNAFRRHGVRYELAVKDWGPSYEGMRWRWCVFDADVIIEYPDWLTIDPLTQGNAPTLAEAQMQALAWINQQRANVTSSWQSIEAPQVVDHIIFRRDDGPSNS